MSQSSQKKKWGISYTIYLFKVAFSSFIFIASLNKRTSELLQQSVILLIATTKLMCEFLLSVYPILLSFENNIGPKLVILSRFCTSTHWVRCFSVYYFNHVMHAQLIVHISHICCITAITHELLLNKRLLNNRSSTFGVAKELQFTNIKMLNTTGWSFLQFAYAGNFYLHSISSRSKLQQVPFVLL